MNRGDYILAWEGGTLSGEETITFFQSLIDDGSAWRLQGMYRRQATALIEAGLCKEITGGTEDERKGCITKAK